MISLLQRFCLAVSLVSVSGLTAKWHTITHLRKDMLLQKSPLNAKPANLEQVLYYEHTGATEIKEADLRRPHAVLFVLHGTFASDSPDFWNEKHPTMKHIKKLAQSLSEDVEIVSFKWGGANTERDRVTGGKQLADIIDSLYNDLETYPFLAALAHSHGGNVINIATHHLQQRSFDLLLYVFTPVRTDRAFYTANPDRFALLYNFYSTGDQVQYLGHVSLGKQYLSRIKNIMKQHGVSGKAFKLLLKGGRKLRIESAQRIVNARVQYNGKAPAHIQKGPFIGFIPQIRDRLEEEYLVHNDLDVDVETALVGSDAVFISIRHPLSQKALKKIADGDAELYTALELQAEKERAVSKQEEARYAAYYHKDMHDKGNRAAQYGTEAFGLLYTTLKDSLPKSK